MTKKIVTLLLLALTGVYGYSQSEQPLNGNSFYPEGQVPVGTLQDVDVIEVGIVLPFLNKSQAISARFIEYYEGFLLAVEEMKAKGLSANVYVFDMGSEVETDKLESLLETTEMKDLDLIIGGFSPQQINMLSDFAQQQGIKYVIPFPTKTDETYRNKEVFQLHAPHELLYDNASNAFADMFGNANVIYIGESEFNGKKDFVQALNNQLGERGMGAFSLLWADEQLGNNLLQTLDANRRNVIVATSGSNLLLYNLLSALNMVREEQPDIDMSLFGHTEWQTYPQFFADFHKNDTHIYTPFYMADSDANTQQFLQNYKQWYNDKSLINTYPKYGALGYDTGMYFLTALSDYGKNFEANILSISVPALQTPISFGKTNKTSGYMNYGFYIVHFNKNGNVDKIEYRK